VILILLFLPLNYWLIKEWGIIGSAYANLISFSIYNLIRYTFLWVRFGLQPYTYKTILSLLLAITGYAIAKYSVNLFEGWMEMFLRTTLFSVIFIAGVFIMKLTPDAIQLYELTKQKVKR
jgi:O-antigen/teichoic acid export membrane protein